MKTQIQTRIGLAMALILALTNFPVLVVFSNNREKTPCP
jgi:hypothetical protein